MLEQAIERRSEAQGAELAAARAHYQSEVSRMRGELAKLRLLFANTGEQLLNVERLTASGGGAAGAGAAVSDGSGSEYADGTGGNDGADDAETF